MPLPPVEFESDPFLTAAGSDLLPATGSEQRGAMFSDPLLRPTQLAYEYLQQRSAEAPFESVPSVSAEFGQEIARPATPDAPKDVKWLTQREIDEQYPGWGIKVEAATPVPVVEIIAQRRKEEILRQDVMARGPQDWASQAAVLGMGFLGAAIDPLNIASAFLPVVSQARGAAWVGRMGLTRGRAAVGLAEGVAGAAVIEPFTYAGAEALDIDYTMSDALLNIAFGGALGVGLHVGGGFIADRIRGAQAGFNANQTSPAIHAYQQQVTNPRIFNARAETIEAALRTAVAQVARGEEVNVTPLFDIDDGVRAFHASPHDFDAFDLTRVGTGQGAQTFGHGIYIAEAEGTGQHYLDTIAFDDTPRGTAGKFMYRHGTKEAALKAYDAEAATGPAAKKSFHEKVREHIEKGDFPEGHLYEVRVLAKPEEFLDRDVRLDRQPPEAQEKIKDIIGKLTGTRPSALPDTTTGVWADDLGHHWGEAEFAQMLRDAGFAGFRYFDQMSRGNGNELVFLQGQITKLNEEIAQTKDAKRVRVLTKQRDRYQAKAHKIENEVKPTRNFVVFDDKRLVITTKDGKEVSRAPTALPAESPATVRFYHGGTSPTTGGGRWATTDPEYAKNFRAGDTPNEVHFVDIPVDDPAAIAARAWDEIDEANNTNMVGRYNHTELPEEWARKMQSTATATTQGVHKLTLLRSVDGEQIDAIVDAVKKMKRVSAVDSELDFADAHKIPIPQADANEFYYHATSAENAIEIATSGFVRTHRPGYGTTDQFAWPDGGKQKRAYFSTKPMPEFAPAEGKPVMLRMAREGVPMRKESGTGDVFSTKRVPAERLEFLNRDGEWEPLMVEGVSGIPDELSDVFDELQVLVGPRLFDMPEDELRSTVETQMRHVRRATSPQKALSHHQWAGVIERHGDSIQKMLTPSQSQDDLLLQQSAADAIARVPQQYDESFLDELDAVFDEQLREAGIEPDNVDLVAADDIVRDAEALIPSIRMAAFCIGRTGVIDSTE